MFKVIIKFPDGTTEEHEETFQSREEAETYALEWISNCNTGGEVLNMSNAGDHPWSEDDEPDFEVIEVGA